MKKLKFILVGIFLGFLFSKSEVASWYRIYEMFKFKSFHMYGIIGSAVVLGIIMIQIIKQKQIKTSSGTEIKFSSKSKEWKRYIYGGTIFGLGWAMTGACPGPMFTLLGNGYISILIVILSTSVGTFLYGYFRDKLPH